MARWSFLEFVVDMVSMTQSRKTNVQWLEEKVNNICDLGQRVGPIRPGTSLNYGAHTVLKLAALNHCLDIFLPIARKRVDEYRQFDSALYIDLFAGCGATRVTDTGDWLAGSPVIAADNPLAFDKVVCIEKDEAFCDALRSRLALFPERDCLVLQGDCNKLIHDLKDQIGFRNPLAFVFVDPEGMQTDWKTLEALSSQFRCMDLLLNLPCGAERVLGDLRSGREVNQQVMDAFAGKDWPMLLLEEEKGVVDFIESKISEVLGKQIGDKVLVKDTGNRPMYSLLVRVRQTAGGSPFFKGYEEMLKRVGGLKPKVVLGVLNKKFGRSIERFG